MDRSPDEDGKRNKSKERKDKLMERKMESKQNRQVRRERRESELGSTRERERARPSLC